MTNETMTKFLRTVIRLAVETLRGTESQACGAVSHAIRTTKVSSRRFAAANRLYRLAGLTIIGILTFAGGSAIAQDPPESNRCIKWGSCELRIDDSCEECPDERSCIRIICEEEDDTPSGVCSPEQD